MTKYYLISLILLVLFSCSNPKNIKITSLENQHLAEIESDFDFFQISYDIDKQFTYVRKSDQNIEGLFSIIEYYRAKIFTNLNNIANLKTPDYISQTAVLTSGSKYEVTDRSPGYQASENEILQEIGLFQKRIDLLVELIEEIDPNVIVYY